MSSVFISMLKMKCPKCHKGNLFLNPNPYKLSALTKMPEKCTHCGQAMQPETGFYYGAMYFSYVICVFISLIDFFVFDKFLGFSGVAFLVINGLVLVVLWPVIFRYARVTLIYLYVKYDPPKVNP